jgi:hypothetical protein
MLEERKAIASFTDAEIALMCQFVPCLTALIEKPASYRGSAYKRFLLALYMYWYVPRYWRKEVCEEFKGECRLHLSHWMETGSRPKFFAEVFTWLLSERHKYVRQCIKNYNEYKAAQ